MGVLDDLSTGRMYSSGAETVTTSASRALEIDCVRPRLSLNSPTASHLQKAFKGHSYYLSIMDFFNSLMSNKIIFWTKHK